MTEHDAFGAPARRDEERHKPVRCADCGRQLGTDIDTRKAGRIVWTGRTEWVDDNHWARVNPVGGIKYLCATPCAGPDGEDPECLHQFTRERSTSSVAQYRTYVREYHRLVRRLTAEGEA